MSASAKKKLRKEETAAQLTEKQLKAQKETKKLKIYTTIFVVAIVLVLVAGLAIAGTTLFKSSGIQNKNTVAAVIDDYEFSTVEMSYYYVDTIESNYNNWYNNYGENTQMFMALMGLDITKPLNAQPYSEDATWDDYFVEQAMAKAKNDYLLVKQAEADGYTMSEESLNYMNESFELLPTYAAVYGFDDVDKYLQAFYGPGANMDTYRVYAERSALATDYYTAYQNNLVIDDAAIRAYEAENFDKFSSFSYASYVINYNAFLTGGTEDENGNVTYSDEEKDAARAAAKAAAEALPACATEEELNDAITDITADAKCTVNNNVLYTSISANAAEWMADSNRKDGDFTVIANETATTDANGQQVTLVNSYTAYVFLGRNDNTRPLANVRHLLVAFEGGTTDDNGNTVYSEEEKAAAYEKAADLLAQYEAGEKTENAFAELAAENTDDTASAENGGLYENISPKPGVYVEAFTNWSVDPERKAGDTGIIETPYGYHIMYYVGDADITYRDSMIRDEIRTNSVTQWRNDILATAEIVEKDTSLLDRDRIIHQQ